MLLQSPIKDSIAWDEIRYSLVWEDGQRLRQALQILPSDHVLSIGSAGCNSLELLLSDPHKITVIDLSPAQHALLNLKYTAISYLDYDSFISLFGIDKKKHAFSIYRSLRTYLLPSTREYFDHNSAVIEKGLIHQGRLEKYFHLFREKGIQKIWNSEFLQELKACPSLDAQAKLLQERGQLSQFSILVKQFFNRTGLENARDPGQMKYVSESQLAEALFQRFLETLKYQLVSENPYLFYFLTGEMPDESRRIHSLRRENYPILKARIERIELVQADLESYLSQCSGESLQKMNLSDIFEYLSPEHCQIVFALLAQKLSSGGRIAYWSLFVDRAACGDQLKRLQNNDPDRVWFYKDFAVYEKK